MQDSKDKQDHIKNLYFVILLVIFSFLADLLVPLGVAAGSLYMIPTLVASQNQKLAITIGTPIACSTLILFGLFYSPETLASQQWKVYTNRIISIMSVWITSFLGIRMDAQRRLAIQSTLNLEKKEIQLEKAIKKLKTVTKGSNDGFWKWDIINNTLEWDDQLFELIQYKPDEFEENFEVFLNFLHPEDIGPTQKAIEDHLHHKAPFDVEYRWRVKSGEYKWFRGKGKAFRDKKGTPTHMAGSITDIHHMKILEQNLKVSNEELDQFAYIASHDLKTPLRGIQTYCEILQEDFGETHTHEENKLINDIIQQSKRMELFIRDLLAFSRVGRVDLALCEVNLEDLVKEIIKDFEMSKKSNVSIKIIGNLPQVYADRIRIGELFRNLIENGIKYNESEQKLIEIGQIEGKSNTFFVKDNGIGIKDQHRNVIFKIFKRLHREDEYGGGSGAGLTFVKKIIERHKGNIWVESDEKGSTFMFTIGLEKPTGDKNEHTTI